jgi:hypothetical protein
MKTMRIRTHTSWNPEISPTMRPVTFGQGDIASSMISRACAAEKVKKKEFWLFDMAVRQTRSRGGLINRELCID